MEMAAFESSFGPSFRPFLRLQTSGACLRATGAPGRACRCTGRRRPTRRARGRGADRSPCSRRASSPGPSPRVREFRRQAALVAVKRHALHLLEHLAPVFRAASSTRKPRGMLGAVLHRAAKGFGLEGREERSIGHDACLSGAALAHEVGIELACQAADDVAPLELGALAGLISMLSQTRLARHQRTACSKPAGGTPVYCGANQLPASSDLISRLVSSGTSVCRGSCGRSARRASGRECRPWRAWRPSRRRGSRGEDRRGNPRGCFQAPSCPHRGGRRRGHRAEG